MKVISHISMRPIALASLGGSGGGGVPVSLFKAGVKFGCNGTFAAMALPPPTPIFMRPDAQDLTFGTQLFIFG